MGFFDTLKTVIDPDPAKVNPLRSKEYAEEKAGEEAAEQQRMDTAMSQGMEKGKALGSELMSDPDLLESRGQLKEQLALTGPSRDLINQQASKGVEQMRYKGAKLSPMQQVEAQRKLSSDIGAQKFMEDQQKAKDIYNVDLQKAKFLGQMSMTGALAATAGVKSSEEQKSGISRFF